MEQLVQCSRVHRPNGDEVLVDEYRDMVDTSARFTSTGLVRGMKRLALRTGEPVRQIEEGVFQLVQTGEIMIAAASRH
jgi:hypothetical protein